MRLAFFIFSIALGVGLAQVPLTNKITVTVPSDGSVTELAIIQRTNLPFPALRPVPPVPLSVQMRQAMQEAHGRMAPWSQRFIAQSVTMDAQTRAGGIFSTNYVVTLAPVADDTNAPVAWGAIESRTFRLEMLRPTKRGDEFILYPVTE